MTLAFSLADITLVFALIALAVTLLVYVTLRRQIARIETVGRELDAPALVQEFSQRLRRLEERLVDQKVKFEILELRQQRQNDSAYAMSKFEASSTVTKDVPAVQEVYRVPHENELLLQKSRISESRPAANEILVRSEMEALKFVLESGTKGATARDIQGRIGRSREHTARMMNMLFKEGLVQRNSETRPFNYRITEKGKLVVRE